jgi:hypothetical protein
MGGLIMYRLALLVTSFAALAGLGRPTTAQTLYSTGFENPPFQAGQPLVGQDGWVNQVFMGTPLGPNAAISTAHPESGLQSVQVNGADLTPVAPAGLDLGSYRQFVNFDDAAAGFPIVRVEVDARLDGPKTDQTSDHTTGDFFSVNLATFAANGDDLGEMSLSSDGHVYSYSTDDSYLFEQPYNSGQYVHLALDLNFAAKTTTFQLNGQVLGSALMDTTANDLSRGSLVVYAQDPDSLSRDRSLYTAYYDNFSIRAGVPEPSSLVLLAVGGLSICGLRTRRTIS